MRKVLSQHQIPPNSGPVAGRQQKREWSSPTWCSLRARGPRCIMDLESTCGNCCAIVNSRPLLNNLWEFWLQLWLSGSRKKVPQDGKNTKLYLCCEIVINCWVLSASIQSFNLHNRHGNLVDTSILSARWQGSNWESEWGTHCEHSTFSTQ